MTGNSGPRVRNAGLQGLAGDKSHKARRTKGLSSNLMIQICALLCMTMFGVAGLAQGTGPAVPGPAAVEKQKPPSLAELARQERERRGDREVRVIRNEDLRSMRRARVVTGHEPLPVVGPEGEDEASDGSVPAEGEPDLSEWEAAFSQARTDLQTVVNQRMVLELRMNNLRNAYFTNPDGVTRERIEVELAQTFSEVEQAREDERAARQAIADLEQQAVRAGIPAGRVRELVGKLPESKSVFEGVPEAGGQTVPES